MGSYSLSACFSRLPLALWDREKGQGEEGRGEKGGKQVRQSKEDATLSFVTQCQEWVALCILDLLGRVTRANLR